MYTGWCISTRYPGYIHREAYIPTRIPGLHTQGGIYTTRIPGIYPPGYPEIYPPWYTHQDTRAIPTLVYLGVTYPAYPPWYLGVTYPA